MWSIDPEMAYDPSKIHRIEFNVTIPEPNARLEVLIQPPFRQVS